MGSFQNPITIQNNHANNHANNHTNNHTDNHILAFQNLQDLWSHAGSPLEKSVACRATDAGQTDAALHLCGLLAHRGGWARRTDARARLHVKVDAHHMCGWKKSIPGKDLISKEAAYVM